MTLRGAHIGDVFMTLIHSCEFSHANPLDYVMDLQQRANAAAQTPTDRFPWNYPDALESVDTG